MSVKRKKKASGRLRRRRTAPGPRDHAVERAAATIPRVAREAPIDLALELGQIVFEGVFKGDATAVRTRGRKDVSFRKLADHPRVGLSASKLWASCAIYELSLHWPELRKCRHLSLAHLRCVLGLSPSVQRALLARAEKGSWSVSKLADQAASKRRTQGGRPPKSKVVRLLDSVSALQAASRPAMRDARGIAALTPDEVAAGLKATAELRETLAALQTVLRQAKRALGVPA